MVPFHAPRHFLKLSLVAALALGAAEASAQSVVGGDLNVTVAWGGSPAYLDFDNSNGAGVLHNSFIDGDDFEVGFGGSDVLYFRSRVGTALVDSDLVMISAMLFPMANPLADGVHTIGPDRPWRGGNQSVYLDHSSSFAPYWGTGRATSGFVGVSFLNAATGQTNYGFVEVYYDDAANSLTLLRYAYDNTGAALVAGASLSAIPEPSTYAALAGVAVLGLVMWRRKPRAKS